MAPMHAKRPFTSLFAAALALLVSGAAAQAQQALDLDIANDFLTLELAGWRLPSPTDECLVELKLRRLEPMSFGAEDLIDQPELVDPPGNFYRILRVDPDPGDRRRRVVQFEWLIPGAGGARSIRDSFVFALGASAAAQPTMQREPEHMVIRRECFDG